MTEERKRNQQHNKLKTILATVNAHNRTPICLTTAREMMTRVEEIFRDFEKWQLALESTAADNSAFEVQSKAGEEVESTFSDVRGKLRSLIDILGSATSPASSSSSAATPTPSASVKLPVISLPTFEGNFEAWMSFKDLFVSTVANKSELSGARKLQYLKTALRGEPFYLIEDLSSTDLNYAEAWKILTERYDNKREIIRSHVSKLLNLKPLKVESAKDLQALVDTCVKCLRSLHTMGCPTGQWDDLTVVIVEEKLDSATRREWAKCQTGTSTASFDELIKFINTHIRGLQAAGASNSSFSANRRGDKQVRVNQVATQGAHCAICKESHGVHECKEFIGNPASERSAMAKKARLCFNCLKTDHMIRSCPSTRKCKKCGLRHHTLLHEDKSSKGSAEGVPAVVGNHVSIDPRGLLMTALIYVKDKQGVKQPCRVFIDGGSTGDFISERCTTRLGLTRHAGLVNVKGFGDTDIGQSRGMVKTTLYSRVGDDVLDVELHIMKKVTGDLPVLKCQNGEWKHLQGLNLADPRWFQPGQVDILLGTRYYHKLMLIQRIMGPDDNAPVAWDTIFGWVISGTCPVDKNRSIKTFHVVIDPIAQQLRKFWEVEEPPKQRILTQEERKCEEHFIAHYKRDNDGRFIVAVPFNEEKKGMLGKSRDIAFKRLLQVERRLQRNPHLQEQYVNFMKEYLSLGHMLLVPADECGERVGKTNYLCHHFVLNESSTTTKLRVVFDGSAATSTGVSFNDTVMVGATLQDHLYDLLLRFRTHAVVLKADIAKMFRQFKIRNDDADFHRILWRDSPDQPIKEYRLNTVTYGTGYAPNLATRCVQQLGIDCADKYPAASAVLLHDTYVDDNLGGGNSEQEVIELFHQLTEAAATAGLDLRKWISNSPDVMSVIPEEMRETLTPEFDANETVKALGVQWHPSSDVFKFKTIEFSKATTTKRTLLSDLAKLFDPLGLISCVTLRGKLLMQELWKLPVEWDDDVPLSVAERWEEYKLDLGYLQSLTIPRRVTVSGAKRVEIHGFADSSEVGFGAIVYLRSILPDGAVEVNFVTSKTRVAPVRQVTLPRLELCAAVLLAELVVYVKECLKLDVDTYLWSDSTITLTWIAGCPRRWKTFVANRVALIQELTSISCWRHVSGLENPADLASRGCSVEELCNSNFWWKGPQWLMQSDVPVFTGEPPATEDMEERQVSVTVNHLDTSDCNALHHYSCLVSLKRGTAWYIRYLLYKLKQKHEVGHLTADELHNAFLVWIRKSQQQYFCDEYNQLRSGKQVGVKSTLKSLYPFVDNQGVIRVGGRLNAASENKRNQIILPGQCRLAHLIIDHYHNRNFHSGFQLTWSSIQTDFWLVRGRDRVRHFVRQCVRCRRYRASVAEQLMGNLPSPRVTPSRPFLHTGVDYAGAYMLKDVMGRVPKTFKGYMCLFVCLATKAIHLEAVTSLSTEAFVAALRRFVARRGLCSHIYSDCGTNFVGADRELRSFVMTKELQHGVAKECGDRGISWNFNPPASPHRGGLWEAGVKSAKYHLRRVVGNTALTLEHFGTMLAQVEAVLNSRPLYAMSPDPDDLQPLTPGHFLIGVPMNTVPDRKWLEIPRNRLSQFQRIQQQLQQFWQRWSIEYINTLQQRNKWMWDKENVKVGDLVLLAEESSPGTWKMGRILEAKPSVDGKVRVATVKTASSILERPIAKLVILVNDD